MHNEVNMTTYKIMRYYRDDRPARQIASGLSLEEAQAHCKSMKTRKRDNDGIVWFEGYTRESA
jgi:hypothetical protein